MIQLNYSVLSENTDFRVVVVDTNKELRQMVQSVAWINGDKKFYNPSNGVLAAHVTLFKVPMLLFSKQDLTWETITHEATHLSHTLYEGCEEDIATNTGHLVTLIGKDLKKHGCKILLR